MSIQWNSLLPLWLTLLLGGALLAALVYNGIIMRSKQIAPRLVALLTGIRLAVLAVFVLILLQPSFSSTREVPELPELIILVDTSQSMAQPAGDGGSHTRLQDVASVLQSGELADALKQRYGLRWFTFDSTASPRDEKSLKTLTADGASTHIADSITAACNHVRSLGKNPQRLLLASDGNDLGMTDAVEIARRFGLTVDVLAPRPGPQKSDSTAFTIADVQSARRVLVGSETHFRVTLMSRQPAATDQHLAVRISEGSKTILEQPVTIKAGRTEESVVLAHRPTPAGSHEYEFRLVTLPAGKPAANKVGDAAAQELARAARQAVDNGPGQAGADKDAVPYMVPMQVVDSKYEVLILEDTWRWEYKYLHRLFEDDPSFRFSALLSRGDKRKTFAQFGSPDRRVNLIGFPQNRADLESFDTFVIGDVDPRHWPAGLAAELAAQVEFEGKSLVVIAGPNLAHLGDVPVLHRLLPVELSPDSGNPVEGPIKVRFRPESRNSPFFFQIRSSGKDGDRLPPLDQVYPVVRKRAGATVLVEADEQPTVPGARLIVIAEQSIGRGRVLFIGTDTLWKWHTLAPNSEGPTPYTIFWQQAFRALTPLRSNVGSVNLWLSAERSRLSKGNRAVLEAEVQSSRPIAQASIQATVILPDRKTTFPIVFTIDPSSPDGNRKRPGQNIRVYHADFMTAVPGQYQVEAKVLSDNKTVADSAINLHVDDTSKETVDRGIDQTSLARLTQASGGQFIDLAHRETWPNPGDGPIALRQEFHTIDLWNNFTLIFILCGLLAADWFIRLFRGLVSA